MLGIPKLGMPNLTKPTTEAGSRVVRESSQQVLIHRGKLLGRLRHGGFAVTAVAILAMCVTAGLLAARKLRDADPAEMF